MIIFKIIITHLYYSTFYFEECINSYQGIHKSIIKIRVDQLLSTCDATTSFIVMIRIFYLSSHEDTNATRWILD